MPPNFLMDADFVEPGKPPLGLADDPNSGATVVMTGGIAAALDVLGVSCTGTLDLANSIGASAGASFSVDACADGLLSLSLPLPTASTLLLPVPVAATNGMAVLR